MNAGASAATGATVANNPLRTATSSSAVAPTSSSPAATAWTRGVRESLGPMRKIAATSTTAATAPIRPENTGQNSDASRVLP